MPPKVGQKRPRSTVTPTEAKLLSCLKKFIQENTHAPPELGGSTSSIEEIRPAPASTQHPKKKAVSFTVGEAVRAKVGRKTVKGKIDTVPTDHRTPYIISVDGSTEKIAVRARLLTSEAEVRPHQSPNPHDAANIGLGDMVQYEAPNGAAVRFIVGWLDECGASESQEATHCVPLCYLTKVE
jgi:hypothetical protein